MTRGGDRRGLDVADLVAKQEIYDVLCRYCRGIDRLDLDLVRACYHPDAVDHHNGFSGGLEEFLAWAETSLRQMDGTMHSICNHLVEVDGDVAVAETYVHTTHWTARPLKPSHNAQTGTRYVDVFERREGVWRIAERWAVRSWIRTEENGLEVHADAALGPVGRRDRQDPLYLARARAATGLSAGR
jgi:hypothetical protein